MSNGQSVFIGRLTKDVTLKSVGTTNVANTSIAINDSYTDKNGEKVERATFIDLEAWSYRASAMEELKKGQLVMVLASPRMKPGGENQKASLIFNVEEIGVIPRANKGVSSAQSVKSVKKTTKVVEVEATSDDIPF